MSLAEMVATRLVLKRDGETQQQFDVVKISKAIAGAWRDCRKTEVDAKSVEWVIDWVIRSLPQNDIVGVEAIQDVVEIALMRYGMYDVAKAYIIYRQERAEVRNTRKHPDPSALSDYIHPAKYARFQPDLGRRELYEETVARVEGMHLRKFAPLFKNDPKLEKDIRWAFDLVREKRVLPSMRSMQFGGEAIEQNNARMFNCTSTLIDRPRAFAESLYFLLCGAGVGYSVRFDHVDKLPVIQRLSGKAVVHHVVGDTVEGWSDALDALINSYMLTGHYVEFAFHEIRDAGRPLKVSGGKAPGHLPLKLALEQVRQILDAAQGRKLRPIEAHDILCHSADAVLSGGIRRSSLISLFSPDDSEMMYAKTGNWWKTHPWRANANNSVAFLRATVTEKQFGRAFDMAREWGEPGFALLDHEDAAVNPCFEVVMMPITVKKVTGFSGCNLTEMNAAMFETEADFREAVRAATIIGTCQAAYTDFKYLRPETKEIFDRDALLGVSMTGMLDRPDIACDPTLQRRMAETCVMVNVEFAKRIGINSAARTCNVKPSGTGSLELGGVASGIHAHHSKRYFRRVTANEIETVFQHFKAVNPHMCVRKPNGDWVIEFPVEAPEGAKLKEDLGAIDFLSMVRRTQENWVKPGTTRPDPVTGVVLTHNVSNTVHVKPEEWPFVKHYIWHHKDMFTGVSLIPMTGDKQYAFAPFEAVVTEADEARWNQILAGYVPVDYTTMFESEDGTTLKAEAGCAGGSCELKI